MTKAFDLKHKVNIEDGKPNTYTNGQHIQNYMGTFFKMFFMFSLLSINFIALSVALNCNKDSTQMVKYSAAIFAFFFGLVYLLVNFYSYRILTKKQVLFFPFANFNLIGELNLNRKIEKDEKNIEKFINKINNGVIIIFPEGTRKTKKKLIKSQIYLKIIVYQN